MPHLIDNRSGVGVQLTVKDVNNDLRPDVLTASKLGTFVFLNRGAEADNETSPQRASESREMREEPSGKPSFQLTVTDESGAPLPCRVLLKSDEGTCRIPEQATTLATGRDNWFMSPGRSQLQVPSGRYLLRVEHGLEYVRFKEWIDVAAAAEKKTVQLHRWVNMQQRGYLSGENHLHVDTKQLGSMLVAEGLDFGSSLTWWRGPDPRRPVPAGDGPIRLLSFAGRAGPASVFDAELEYAWGAAYIQNLPAPMPLAAEPGRPNLDYLKHAVRSGAIVHYQGGWSREVLIDALQGCVHTVNICNNNFALHRFQPRSRYSNLLKVKDFPIYPDTDTGMLQMNTDTYYRLLNCGLRLAAGAGSATGVKQAPVGYNRTYVRVPADVSIKDFYEAWKRGENFVTNGPILQLGTASGHRPGDTIELPAGGGTIEVKLEVLSDQPLQSVELIHNGEVVAEFDADDPKHVEASSELHVEAGSWIAARCTAHDDLLTDSELEAYADHGSQTGLSVAPSRLRFAHTSPIYVTVGGRGPVVRRSVTESLQMLDRFKIFATEVAEPHHLPPILSAVDEARMQLKRKLEDVERR